MKKIIIFVLLLIFITGCDRFGFMTEEQGDPSQFAQQYRTGFSGLELGFAPDMPPEEIYENSEYKIGIELRNKGAYTIEFVNFNLDISGYDEKYMNLSRKYVGFTEHKEDDIIRPNLQGRNMNNPEGGYDLKVYTGKNLGMPKGIDVYNAVFVINACYSYETRASIDVCIDPFLYDPLRAGKGTCKVGDISMTTGQGGPLGVTEIKEQIVSSGDELNIIFTLKVENRGEGKIREFGKKGECVKTGDVEFDVFLSDQTLQCSFDKYTGMATCIGIIGESNGVYTAPLVVKLGYSYFDSASKTIKVKRIPGLPDEGLCPLSKCKESKSACLDGYGGINPDLRCLNEGVCCKESVPNCCNTNNCKSTTTPNNEEYECRTEDKCETDSIIRYYCTNPEQTCCKVKS